ncbi:MAG TPA: amidohydrolase family protein, partial [Gemmatimonadaceae bacterium]|nr:amidohydrolase family protein [Gemmatimonadaceae bacterium]
DLIELTTVGGAAALGIGDVVGTLEPGKQADLAAFSLDGVAPVHDPLAAALFSVSGSRATFVAVAGRVLVRDAALIGARAGLPQRIDALGDALARWLAAGGEVA